MSSYDVDFKYLAPIMMHGISNSYILIHPVVRSFIFLMLFYATLAPRAFHIRTGPFSVSITFSLLSAPFLSHTPFFIAYFTLLAVQICGFDTKIKHLLHSHFIKPYLIQLSGEIDVELPATETDQHLDAIEALDSIQIFRETRDHDRHSYNANWQHRPRSEIQLPTSTLEDEIGNLMADNWV